MKKIITIITCIAIYALSTWYMWHWMQKTYSKGGKWDNIEPSGSAVFLTYMPVFNTIAMCMFAADDADFSNHFKTTK
jgi:TRAP-type C4-dicarboxylate transport system permease small subunit